MGVDVVDALLALDRQVVVVEVLPQVLGLVGRVGQEGLVTGVRGVVLLDEVANVDVLLPVAFDEAVPALA